VLESPEEASASTPPPPLARLAAERGWTRVDWS